MPLEPSAFLLDLDGTVYVGDQPVTGASDTIARLREWGTPFRFVTNTTSRSRATLAQRLRGFGISAEPAEIHTPAVAAAGVLAERHCEVVAPFSPPASLVDLGEVTLRGGISGQPVTSSPDAVLVGDLGERWSYALMQEAFEYLLDGAVLIALSRDRYFRHLDRLALDAGPFVAGLEYATGREAIVVGKPSPDFFRAAAESLGVRLDAVAVVGDDLWSDVQGAQQAGCAGWLVRTGKFSASALATSGIRPDRTLESIADLLPTLRAGR
jgi:HAD superfamily hydrolase (TIGR01458 family)